MKGALKQIRKVEREAYPSHMRQLQEVESMEELAEYCEGKPHILLLGSHGYLLATEDEVVDLASLRPLTFADLLRVVSFLRDIQPGEVRADLRRGTSWRLFKRLVQKGVVEVLHLEEWSWEGEEMIEVRFVWKGGRNVD